MDGSYRRRPLAFLAVLALLSGLAGCWSWSFPEEELRPRDAAPDGPASDLEPDGPGGPDSLVTDTMPDLFVTDADLRCQVTGCQEDSDEPVCDPVTERCRPCQQHGECNGGLCTLDGDCPAADQVAHVNQDSCGPGPDGSEAAPWCAIPEAIASGRPYVLVQGAGPYTEALVIDADKKIYAELPGQTTLAAPACGDVTINGGAEVVLSGFVIEDSGVVIGGGSTARLVANTIGPSPCIGVHLLGSSTGTLERNLIVGNVEGGLFVDDSAYSIVNNIIVKNGNPSLAVNWGGVKLKPVGTPASFVNNTVAGNVCKASNDKEACGVRCESATPVVNSIFWGNMFNSTGAPENDRQYSPNCQASFCAVEVKPGAVLTDNNIPDDPLFAENGSSDAAEYYHLKSPSPLVNKGTAVGAPAVDYDNQLRTGLPDIGADELLP